MTRAKFRAKLAYARYIASQQKPGAEHCLGCVLDKAELSDTDYYLTGNSKQPHSMYPISRRKLLTIIDASIADFDSSHPKDC